MRTERMGKLLLKSGIYGRCVTRKRDIDNSGDSTTATPKGKGGDLPQLGQRRHRIVKTKIVQQAAAAHSSPKSTATLLPNIFHNNNSIDLLFLLEDDDDVDDVVVAAGTEDDEEDFNEEEEEGETFFALFELVNMMLFLRLSWLSIYYCRLVGLFALPPTRWSPAAEVAVIIAMRVIIITWCCPIASSSVTVSSQRLLCLLC
eukprot:scaffold2913_cov181-Ochromonas_danica.AAC.17